MDSLNEKIDIEIQKTLQVPDDMLRAQGHPYLLTRIKSRLEEKDAPSYFGQQIPVLAMIGILLVLNSFVLFQTLSTSNVSTDDVLTEYLFPYEEENNWMDSLN